MILSVGGVNALLNVILFVSTSTKEAHLLQHNLVQLSDCLYIPFCHLHLRRYVVRTLFSNIFSCFLSAKGMLIILVVLQIHASILRLMEKVYARLTSRQLRHRGRTEATDSSEILAMNWILNTGNYDYQSRKRFVWWVLLLTLMVVALLPAELVSETGISQVDNCTAKPINSTGMCASPWRGRGNMFVSAMSLLASRAKWNDDDWHTLLEGSQKSPVSNEVRTSKALKPGRRVVVTNCSVHVAPCKTPATCGTMSISRSNGPYSSVVTSSSLMRNKTKLFSLGDLTFDGSNAVAFIFWEKPTKRTPPPRRSISFSGVEAILSPSETKRVLREESRPWDLAVDPRRSRLYVITCVTDGLLAEDLTRGVALYRGMDLEQPGVERSDVQSNISRLAPITVNDVVRAAYALKSEDAQDACVGEIDMYEKCGSFEIGKSKYFAGIGLVIVLMWLALHLFVEEDRIPFCTESWRELAHKQAAMLKYYFERAAKNDGSDPKLEWSEYNDDDCILRYSAKKYAFRLPEAILLGHKSAQSQLKYLKGNEDESV